VGHHARMLDLLHKSNAAVVCSPCAWDGSRRFLEGGVDREIDNGENWILDQFTKND